jgi:hypothetical protein
MNNCSPGALTGTDDAAKTAVLFARLECEFTLPCSWTATKELGL